MKITSLIPQRARYHVMLVKYEPVHGFWILWRMYSGLKDIT